MVRYRTFQLRLAAALEQSREICDEDDADEECSTEFISAAEDLEAELELRRQMRNEVNFSRTFEGLVPGCIDADAYK